MISAKLSKTAFLAKHLTRFFAFYYTLVALILFFRPYRKEYLLALDGLSCKTKRAVLLNKISRFVQQNNPFCCNRRLS